MGGEIASPEASEGDDGFVSSGRVLAFEAVEDRFDGDGWKWFSGGS